MKRINLFFIVLTSVLCGGSSLWAMTPPHGGSIADRVAQLRATTGIPIEHIGVNKKNKQQQKLSNELFYAVKGNSLPRVLAALEAGVGSSEYDEFGKIPLHYAAEYGFLEIFRALVQYNPTDLERINFFAHTPLDLAIASGKVAVVREIITARGTLDFGNRLLMHLCNKKKDYGAAIAATFLFAGLNVGTQIIDPGEIDSCPAIKELSAVFGDRNNEYWRFLKSFVETVGVGTKDRSFFEELLCHVALAGKSELVAQLLAANVRVTHLCGNFTPLDCAVLSQDQDTLKLLRDYRFTPESHKQKAYILAREIGDFRAQNMLSSLKLIGMERIKESASSVSLASMCMKKITENAF
jgi:ankyrin repeat protein